MANRALVGEKVGMTQVWKDDVIVPVTVVQVDPCRIVQVKTTDTDGYTAVQVTFGHQKPQRLSGGEAGHFARAGVDVGKRVVELRLDDVGEYAVGQEITADLFEAGDRIDVTAVSKGKGFAGVMKRHNFKGQRASHGAHRVHRAPGSIGACATPSRVFKGMKMAGRMGGERVTVQNLTVHSVDADKGLILVRGAIPGATGGVVLVTNAAKEGDK